MDFKGIMLTHSPYVRGETVEMEKRSVVARDMQQYQEGRGCDHKGIA